MIFWTEIISKKKSIISGSVLAYESGQYGYEASPKKFWSHLANDFYFFKASLRNKSIQVTMK